MSHKVKERHRERQARYRLRESLCLCKMQKKQIKSFGFHKRMQRKSGCFLRRLVFQELEIKVSQFRLGLKCSFLQLCWGLKYPKAFQDLHALSKACETTGCCPLFHKFQKWTSRQSPKDRIVKLNGKTERLGNFIYKELTFIFDTYQFHDP